MCVNILSSVKLLTTHPHTHTHTHAATTQNEILIKHEQLREARDDKNKSKESEKLSAALEALKRHFP